MLMISSIPNLLSPNSPPRDPDLPLTLSKQSAQRMASSQSKMTLSSGSICPATTHSTHESNLPATLNYTTTTDSARSKARTGTCTDPSGLTNLSQKLQSDWALPLMLTDVNPTTDSESTLHPVITISIGTTEPSPPSTTGNLDFWELLTSPTELYKRTIYSLVIHPIKTTKFSWDLKMMATEAPTPILVMSRHFGTQLHSTMSLKPIKIQESVLK